MTATAAPEKFYVRVVASTIERGQLAGVPFAATGAGRPLVVLPRLTPMTGVDSDQLVWNGLAPVRKLADHRRLVVLNRWPNLPPNLTMAALASGLADAIREAFAGEPVDLFGTSTGGSIAQQIAAEHSDVVGRLVLLSTGYRLGPVGRRDQAGIAALGDVDPAGGRVVRVGRGGVERNRGTRRVTSDQIDDLFEQETLIVCCAQTPTDDNAFPRSSPDGLADGRDHVVTAVDADQAGLDGDAMLSKSSESGVDGRCHRHRVPRPGNPMGVESDDEDAGCRDSAHPGEATTARAHSGSLPEKRR